MPEFTQYVWSNTHITRMTTLTLHSFIETFKVAKLFAQVPHIGIEWQTGWALVLEQKIVL
jgi:hypothetical protein